MFKHGQNDKKKDTFVPGLDLWERKNWVEFPSVPNVPSRGATSGGATSVPSGGEVYLQSIWFCKIIMQHIVHSGDWSLQSDFYEEQPAAARLLLLLKCCKWNPLDNFVISGLSAVNGILKYNQWNPRTLNIVMICLLVVSGAVRVQSSSSEKIICKHCNRSISRHSDHQGFWSRWWRSKPITMWMVTIKKYYGGALHWLTNGVTRCQAKQAEAEQISLIIMVILFIMVWSSWTS